MILERLVFGFGIFAIISTLVIVFGFFIQIVYALPLTASLGIVAFILGLYGIGWFSDYLSNEP